MTCRLHYAEPGLTLNSLSELFLVFLCVATVVVVWTAHVKHLRRRWMASAALGVLLVVGIFSISISYPQGNILSLSYLKLVNADRSFLVCIIAGIAMGILLGRSILVLRGESGEVSTVGLALLSVITMGLSAVIAKDHISPYVSTSILDSVRLQTARMVADDFKVTKICELGIFPTSIAVDDSDNVFVAGYSGIAFQNGVVVRVEGGASRVVASHLNRPHGIAFSGSDLYVSRAGQHSAANDGRITQLNTGYVTKLQDLNGDGDFDFYQDIISDLPGAWLPDGLHQNNGIDFDNDGNMFITVGAPSDHGPSLHPFSGTILRYSEKEGTTEVFAKGFRNPFGICVADNGRVYCTDNDSSVSNKGDCLYLVEEGMHYGHPYRSVSADFKLIGAGPALADFQSAQGVLFVPKGALPPGFDDCIYVASYGENRIYRIALSADPSSRNWKQTLIEIERPIDLALTSSGKLLVACCEINSVFEIDFNED